MGVSLRVRLFGVMFDQFLPELIAQYGLIAVVIIWWLFKSDKVISANTEAITKLSLVVTELCSKIGVD